MPTTMTERDGGSKKALLVALVLVVIAGGGSWFAFVRKSPLALLAAPVARAEAKSAETSLPVGQAATVAAGASHSGLNPENVNASAVPPGSHAASGDSVSHKHLATEKSRVARESSPTTLDVNLSAPTIPSSVDVDAVTRGIEQSTKAKIDSAQKPRIDVKQIFKKP